VDGQPLTGNDGRRWRYGAQGARPCSDAAHDLIEDGAWGPTHAISHKELSARRLRCGRCYRRAPACPPADQSGCERAASAHRDGTFFPWHGWHRLI